MPFFPTLSTQPTVLDLALPLEQAYSPSRAHLRHLRQSQRRLLRRPSSCTGEEEPLARSAKSLSRETRWFLNKDKRFNTTPSFTSVSNALGFVLSFVVCRSTRPRRNSQPDLRSRFFSTFSLLFSPLLSSSSASLTPLRLCSTIPAARLPYPAYLHLLYPLLSFAFVALFLCILVYRHLISFLVLVLLASQSQ
jgi:hypothetical protein